MTHFAKRGQPQPLPAVPGGRCPAKTTADGGPGISVLDHCRVVGQVAAALRERLCPAVAATLPEYASTLAALHDVGKVSPGFLKKHFQAWLGANAPRIAEQPGHLFEDRHAIISEAALVSWAVGKGWGADWRRWSQSLGGHHGTREEPIAEPCGKYGGRTWQAGRLELIDLLADEYGPLADTAPSAQALQLTAGLTCVADWVGSNEEWFPPGVSPAPGRIEEHARNALDAAGLNASTIRGGLAFGDLFPGYRPNEIQCALHEMADARGLYIVEAPTGIGKTEAALYAAYRLMSEGHNQGLYFALPTRLTSNRVHQRIGPFLDRAFGPDAAAQLVHGQSWLMQRPPGGEELGPGGAWFAPIKRALLAPFGVGTVDQALLAVLNVRHAFVRSFGLAGKVVILDEVHSYDAYTGTLLEMLIRWLLSLHCTVIVLSATLTVQRRAQLLGAERAQDGAYPLLSARRDGVARAHAAMPPPSKCVHCRYASPELDQLAALAAERADAGQTVLWINNTVARSQAAYRSARAAVREGTPVGLLHSRFPAWRRDELEDEWLARLGKEGDRDGGSILVATQIVEQSVDIDADFMITDLAPTDMLLQRLGRLWRHDRPGRSGKPACLIAGHALETAADADALRELTDPSCWVYAPYVLWRSYRLWHARDEVRVPDDTRDLLEATYTAMADDDPRWVAHLLAELEERRRRLERQAWGYTRTDLPTLSDDEDQAPTRWSDRPMIQALLVRHVDSLGHQAHLTLADGQELQVQAGGRSLPAARAVHRNLVSLPRHPDFGATATGPPYLGSCVHGAVVVLSIDETGLLRTGHRAETGYAYDDWLGVRRVPRQEGPASADELEDLYESDW